MQKLFWDKFGQNPLSGYWDTVIFIFCAILVTANGSHIGNSKLQNNQYVFI